MMVDSHVDCAKKRGKYFQFGYIQRHGNNKPKLNEKTNEIALKIHGTGNIARKSEQKRNKIIKIIIILTHFSWKNINVSFELHPMYFPFHLNFPAADGCTVHIEIAHWFFFGKMESVVSMHYRRTNTQMIKCTPKGKRQK